MKAKITSLLTVIVSALALTSCYAQSYNYSNSAYDRGVSVQATSSDISYNLDLRAVASVFADSRNLEEFEHRLNDYDEGINNLDLNQDGQVDYLRVIETSKGNSRLVVIQAVLDRDVYQDVASIVLERRWNKKTYVQIIGDPYLYGPYYIIEPVYVYTPVIFSWIWAPSYVAWHSPYYWGYYPSYFHYWGPRPMNIYVNNINIYINKSHNRYNYSDRIRSNNYSSMRREVSRTDYERMNPSRSFASRNADGRANNKRDLVKNGNHSRVASNVGTNNGRYSTSSRQINSSSSRNDNGVQSSRSTRSREDWTAVRQSRTSNGVEGRSSTRSQQDVNSSRPSRGSYDSSTRNTSGYEQRTRANDDAYTRPSRSNSNNTYSQPSRSTSRSSETYSQPSRSNSSRSSETYSQPSRSSSSGKTYSAPSRSSSPSRSSQSSSSQPSRNNSSDNSGRSSSGRR
ncbi:conserved exported hypothetical protein [uncultured Paludibacter sp.]|uniref:DUF3300 domain-containing protein n=1 Tax=uncultured Paludibacter sp. TaxID=497635 RepID=A0A653AIM8_9BACT|nr:conserved exported hypothetical protein [uncultured Paludibacter sp.]